MCAAIDDIDALFNDVGEVQKELEIFGAERVVDANEIYELLETHYCSALYGAVLWFLDI
jgi:hypothetical protein